MGGFELETQTRPDGRHRKALRAAALDLHILATAIKRREGHVPADNPPGYLDAFSLALRERARLLERLSKSASCAEAKKQAFEMAPASSMTADLRAAQNATLALSVMVNKHAGNERIQTF